MAQAAQEIYNGIRDYLDWYFSEGINAIHEETIEISSHCPVDLKITDPLGRVFSIQTNGISDAIYESSSEGDTVFLPEIGGNYLISVIPEGTALHTDTFTLEMTRGGVTNVLAQSALIADILNDPCIFSTESTSIAFEYTPTTVNRPENNELKLTLTLTSLSTGSGIPQKDVQVQCYVPSGSSVGWTAPVTVTTDDTGIASLVLIVPSDWPNGEYIVKAIFAGDETYSACIKNTGPINSGGNFFVVPEYLFGGLATLGACFAALVLVKRKSIIESI